MKINILFEDNHILVAEKPVNIPSQKDKSNDEDMLSILKKDIKKRYNKPGNVYLGLLHRLDRPAGGVMVFAKTSKAASRISRQIRSGEFKKTYLAVVHGRMKKHSSSLKDYILKDRDSNKVIVYDIPVKGAKEALLFYEELEFANGLSLLKIDLHTGRPHQIRAQLANAGCPLWGDQKYGDKLAVQGRQLALWSVMVKFIHPVSLAEETFTSIPAAAKSPWDLFTSLPRSLS